MVIVRQWEGQAGFVFVFVVFVRICICCHSVCLHVILGGVSGKLSDGLAVGGV